MKLHEDRAAFAAILEEISEEFGLRRDVLEKDYYVTLLLKELSKKQDEVRVYFKGGTALYKALRSIRRFSEDIDLSVYADDLPTESQKQKRLKNAALKFICLAKGRTLENKRGSITCEYNYDPLYAVDEEDALQRFGNVRVEATSFTVSRPVENVAVSPYLYELCGEEKRRILEREYGVGEFFVKTIGIERIFIDKIFASEFYYVRRALADASKHIYDIAVLMQNERIKEFLSDEKKVAEMVGLKRTEEKARIGGIPETLDIKDFSYFDSIKTDAELKRSFQAMQRIYVFSAKDMIAYESLPDIFERLRQIFACLK